MFWNAEFLCKVSLSPCFLGWLTNLCRSPLLSVFVSNYNQKNQHKVMAALLPMGWGWSIMTPEGNTFPCLSNSAAALWLQTVVEVTNKQWESQVEKQSYQQWTCICFYRSLGENWASCLGAPSEGLWNEVLQQVKTCCMACRLLLCTVLSRSLVRLSCRQCKGNLGYFLLPFILFVRKWKSILC